MRFSERVEKLKKLINHLLMLSVALLINSAFFFYIFGFEDSYYDRDFSYILIASIFYLCLLLLINISLRRFIEDNPGLISGSVVSAEHEIVGVLILNVITNFLISLSVIKSYEAITGLAITLTVLEFIVVISLGFSYSSRKRLFSKEIEKRSSGFAKPVSVAGDSLDDYVRVFLNENVIEKPGNSIDLDKIYKTFSRWCYMSGISRPAKPEFVRQLRENGLMLEETEGYLIVVGVEVNKNVKTEVNIDNQFKHRL